MADARTADARGRRGARSAAWAVVVIGSSLFASCTDLLVGDSQDVSAELCAALQDCEVVDPICADIDARFALHSDAATNDDFLRYHAKNDCTVSCSNARACRDKRPICSAAGSPCEEDVDCCGSTQGVGTCRGGACCVPRGAPCADEDACGGGEGCENGRCGQAFCALVGEGCARNTDCCSLLCRSGACDARTCSDFGESCLLDEDCCPNGDSPLACRDGLCQNPPASCNACSPVDDPALNCCLTLEVPSVCYVRVDGTSFCAVEATCSQGGVECGSSGDCCGGATCEPSVYPHCCQLEGGPCTVDIGCCAGLQCVSEVCTP